MLCCNSKMRICMTYLKWALIPLFINYNGPPEKCLLIILLKFSSQLNFNERVVRLGTYLSCLKSCSLHLPETGLMV